MCAGTHRLRLIDPQKFSQQGKGVVGVKSGNETLRIFPGALQVLQAIHAGKYPGPMRLAIASAAFTPDAVQISKVAMAMLEVVPGRFL